MTVYALRGPALTEMIDRKIRTWVSILRMSDPNLWFRKDYRILYAQIDEAEISLHLRHVQMKRLLSLAYEKSESRFLLPRAPRRNQHI